MSERLQRARWGPLCVELFAGTFGWSQGWLERGGTAIGVDIEHEAWHGPVPENAHLILQDVRTLHGSQFRDASLILASSPCPEYSYMAMPWKRAKQIARALRGQDVFPDGYRGSRSIDELNELFLAPQRIQREACEAAGRYIPLIQENVKGAQPWVGKAAARYGSYYLWGDVPALMPHPVRGVKVTTMGAGWYPPDHPKHVKGLGFNTHAEREIKNTGGSWFNIGSPGQKFTNRNPVHDAMKGEGGSWFGASDSAMRQGSSKSPARRAASAAIARIPTALSRHIADCFYPDVLEAAS